MGMYDRQYWRGFGGGTSPVEGGGMSSGYPRPPRAVKILLLATIGVYVLQLPTGRLMSKMFAVIPEAWWQPWRYLTFQFLHSTTDIWHIGMNMLALYMFGSLLERQWGTRRFTWFYLSCGATAGALYAVVASLAKLNVPLVGASGGVYGILLACAVLFPDARLLVLFFPMRMRTFAAIYFGIMILTVLAYGPAAQSAPGEFWSQIAHLGGSLCAAGWLWGPMMLSRRGRFLGGEVRRGEGAWQRRMEQRDRDDAEVDRILQKIRDRGITSLTEGEKRILQEATRRQQEQDSTTRRL